MSERQLLAILAAIIFAGADDSEGEAGYSVAGAIDKADAIMRAAKEWSDAQ